MVDGTDDILTPLRRRRRRGARRHPARVGLRRAVLGQVGVSWEARGVSYRDLFPEPPADAGLSCEIDGILPTVCTVTGGMMAGEVLKLSPASASRSSAGWSSTTRSPAAPARSRTAGAGPIPGDAPAPATPPRPRSARPVEGRRRPRSPTSSPPDAPPLLLDVREPWEAAIAAIAGSTLIPLGELGDRVGELDPAASVVVYCHLGVRSEYAAELLASAGFADVRNLAGGIDAWSRTVDATAELRY